MKFIHVDDEGNNAAVTHDIGMCEYCHQTYAQYELTDEAYAAAMAYKYPESYR